jgi:hypothetical protein
MNRLFLRLRPAIEMCRLYHQEIIKVFETYPLLAYSGGMPGSGGGADVK